MKRDVPVLLIRCDAGPTVGTGHFMRCLALAEAWTARTDGEVLFAAAEMPPPLAARAEQQPRTRLVRIAGPAASTADAEATARLAKTAGACWTVVDGYRFGEDFLAALRAAGLPVLLVDDTGHLGRYDDADLILNQNLHASPAMYAGADAARLLLGPRYCLLRREFQKTRRQERRGAAQRLVVAMGGADPHAITPRAVQALPLMQEPMRTVVVVGAANPRLSELRALAEDTDLPVEIRHDVRNMAALMQEADVMLSTAGTTVWEACCLGLPLLLGSTAPQEHQLAEALARHEGCVYVGDLRDMTASDIAGALDVLARDEKRRRDLSRRAMTIVDGHGGERVVDAMTGGR